MTKRIAVIPGDGIGPEVIDAGLRILNRVNDARNNYAAVYLGAFGDPRIPDMKHAADILLGMRFQLDLYVNYRPVKLLNERLCPLKGKGNPDIDFVIFRENTEGAYVGMGGNFKKGTSEEIAIQEDVSTRKGVE